MKNRKNLVAGLGAVAATVVKLAALAALLPQPAAAVETGAVVTRDALVARGRYLVSITGCNDCHTVGYSQSAGATPVSQWLTGSPVGFKGPWGGSYPANLRLKLQAVTEDQWLSYARTPRLPPMPWFAMRDMSDSDLRAMYRFIRSLGPAGQHAPTPVAPGGVVKTPVIPFVPETPELTANK